MRTRKATKDLTPLLYKFAWDETPEGRVKHGEICARMEDVRKAHGIKYSPMGLRKVIE